MKTKKEKFIDEFKNFKKIHKLTKPRSPIIIEFMTDDLPDEWLIDIIRYKKTGLVVDNFIIISKEIAHWVDTYIKDGYILV